MVRSAHRWLLLIVSMSSSVNWRNRNIAYRYGGPLYVTSVSVEQGWRPKIDLGQTRAPRLWLGLGRDEHQVLICLLDCWAFCWRFEFFEPSESKAIYATRAWVSYDERWIALRLGWLLIETQMKEPQSRKLEPKHVKGHSFIHISARTENLSGLVIIQEPLVGSESRSVISESRSNLTSICDTFDFAFDSFTASSHSCNILESVDNGIVKFRRDRHFVSLLQFWPYLLNNTDKTWL